MDKRKYDLEINAKEIERKDPMKAGWYICKYLKVSEGAPSILGYSIDTYRPALLFWEGDLWVVHPRSYQTVDKRCILEWHELPDGFDFIEQTIKINYDKENEHDGERF